MTFVGAALSPTFTNNFFYSLFIAASGRRLTFQTCYAAVLLSWQSAEEFALPWVVDVRTEKCPVAIATFRSPSHRPRRPTTTFASGAVAI